MMKLKVMLRICYDKDFLVLILVSIIDTQYYFLRDLNPSFQSLDT